MGVENSFSEENQSTVEDLVIAGKELLRKYQSHLAFYTARGLISQEPLYPVSIPSRPPTEY